MFFMWGEKIMIEKGLIKGTVLILTCCLVFTVAGCGKKSKTVTTESTTKVVTEQETKKNAGNEEQVTIAVKDSEGNTVEVAGIVETKDNGQKVVIIQDRDGNRKEIKADNFEEGDSNSVITITDESVADEISEAAKDDKIPKVDEVISTKPSADIADNSNNNNGGNSSSDNGGNSAPNESEAKPSTPNTSSHEHNWEPVYETVHHDAVTREEQVWVVDKAAWDEPVYSIIYICKQCERGMCERCNSLGIAQAEFSTNDERKEHQYACLDEEGSCSSSTTRKKITGYTHHDEEGHYETQTVTVTEAYDEQRLVGYKCSSCGERK